jgi:hypothetical protein
MTPDQMLLFAQIGVSLATLGGLGFSIGRLYGRFDSFENRLEEFSDRLGRIENRE